LLSPEERQDYQNTEQKQVSPKLGSQTPQFIANYPIQKGVEEIVHKYIDQPLKVTHVDTQDPDNEALVKPKAMSTKDKSFLFQDRWVVSFILCGIILVFIILGIIISPLLFVGAALVEIIYFVEYYFSDTFKFLRNSKSALSIYDILNTTKTEKPFISWKSDSYHNVTDLVHVSKKDSNGKSYIDTELRERKVYTHHATQIFEYSKCEDLSQTVSEMENYSMCRVYIKKELTFYDDASHRAYEDEKTRFMFTNNKDTYQDFVEYIRISELAERFLAYGGDSNRLPELLNSCNYFLMTLIFLGWGVRLWMHMNSVRVDLSIIKQIRK